MRKSIILKNDTFQKLALKSRSPRIGYGIQMPTFAWGGTDIRYIEELFGYQSSTTTEIYTQVSNREIKEIRSPIEDMDIKI